MQFVQSQYRSKWRGIILSQEQVYCPAIHFRKAEFITMCKVLILLDKNGNRMRKRHVKSLNIDWLVQTPEFDISWVNKDWLK